MVEAKKDHWDPAGIPLETFRKGRLGHAVLLHGPILNSLEKVTEKLAGEILGTSGSPAKHPDCRIIRPINRMRQIGVEPIRDLVKVVSHTANQGGRKVGIIVEADRMNLQASNAFLKTLEEPPADTNLILISARPNDLLDTIRSRCLSFKIPGGLVPIETPEWKSWLEDFDLWLTRIEKPPRDRKETSETVLRTYGLVQRFQETLTLLSASRLEEALEDLPDDMDDEQRAAVSAGVERGARSDLLAGISSALRDWVVSRSKERNEVVQRIRKLVLAVEETEMTAGLLALNFNGTAAIEQLLIKILRVWSRQ
ncbi:MAG: hypothetical protein AAGJ81_02915 [Verrucomicrobiota bacterium]